MSKGEQFLGLSRMQLTLLLTGKLILGVGFGVVIASHFYYAQPYWFILVLIGVLLIYPVLFSLYRFEQRSLSEEKKSQHQ